MDVTGAGWEQGGDRHGSLGTFWECWAVNARSQADWEDRAVGCWHLPPKLDGAAGTRLENCSFLLADI